MNDLLNKLAMAVNATGQRVSFDFSCMGNDSYKVLIRADIGATPSNASDKEVYLRAAIATPFLMTGSITQIANDFDARLSSHIGALDEAKSQLSAINAAVQKAAKSSSNGTNSTKPENETVEKTDVDSSAEVTTPIPAQAEDIFSSGAETTTF